MVSPTDRIEKKVLLRAPRERVWRAIADAEEFGRWFGARLEGDFAPSARMVGQIVPTTVDPEVAKMQEPYSGAPFEFVVDRVEPTRLFSFRWHPFAINPNVDYSNEPMTTVEFELEDAPGGTMLTITESGFDQIPLARRAAAFEANGEGWDAQLRLIEKYVTDSSA